MKASIIRQVLRYILLLLISMALFWFALRGVEISELAERISEVEWSWVVLSLLASLISLILRAWRWKMLFKPVGFSPSLGITFNSLMVGYLANFALPRFGEVARCGVLRKNAGIPIPTSFGTVLAERALDFIMLLTAVGVTLLLEFNKLEVFLTDIFSGESRFSSTLVVWLLVAVAILGSIGIYLWRIYHLRLMKFKFYQKVIGFGNDLLAGLLSIGKVEHQLAFWTCTLLIWVLYYYMTYLILFSLPHGISISFGVGLSLLAMGGIAMAAPVQGGIGTYHVLVSGTLMLYGLSKGDAAFLTLLMHTSQSLFVIIIGSICLLISLIKGTKALQHEAKPA
ncbi:integral membrane protein [Flammeovirgaceae bacterium 311]|nr:integral membrane protein [Flammeovirgaceae bacterium 311]